MFNTQMAAKLAPVAKQNEQAMRLIGAKARQERDFNYAHRVDVQARKWSEVATKAPAGWGQK